MTRAGRLLLALLVLAGCAAAPSQLPTTTNPGSSPTTAAPGLDLIPVVAPSPMAGYSRAQFGPAWADVDHNGCDTRDDVLARDLAPRVVAADGCTVVSGVLADPYTCTPPTVGQDPCPPEVIGFTRGVGTSTAVQIDHVVALGNAWATGAQALPATGPGSREALANDPTNLLAVKGSVNQAKGDRDAAGWMPPRRAEWCDYATRQVTIKLRYHLWVTTAERAALATALATC